MSTLLIVAVLVLLGVVLPAAMIYGLVDTYRKRERGCGGISSVVGPAMAELQRVVQPSVEHVVETQQQVVREDDDTGGR